MVSSEPFPIPSRYVEKILTINRTSDNSIPFLLTFTRFIDLNLHGVALKLR